MAADYGLVFNALSGPRAGRLARQEKETRSHKRGETMIIDGVMYRYVTNVLTRIGEMQALDGAVLLSEADSKQYKCNSPWQIDETSLRRVWPYRDWFPMDWAKSK